MNDSEVLDVAKHLEETVAITDDSQGSTYAKYYYYDGRFLSRFTPEEIREDESDDEQSKSKSQSQQSGASTINLKYLWRNKTSSDVLTLIENELVNYDSDSDGPTDYRRDEVRINYNIEN